MSSLPRLLSFPVLLGLLLASTNLSAGAQTGDSQSFGSVAVGQSTTQTVTFVTNNSRTQLSTSFGKDFTASATTCTPAGGTGPFPNYNCSATVTFAPTAPGLRLDSIFYPNSDGVPVFQQYFYGTGIGAQIGFTFGSFANAAPSVANPGGITIGPDGLVYISSTSSKDVFVSNPDGSNQQASGFRGLSSPGAIAVDGEDNVYVADRVNNLVYGQTQHGVQHPVPTTPLSDPIGLAVDGMGDLYIADAGNSRIIKLDNSGEETTVATGLTSLVGIAVDAAGDIYYAQAGTINTVYEYPGGNTSARVTIGQSNFGTIQGIAVDAGGSVAIAASGGLNVISSFQSRLGTGFNGPTSVAIDPQGNIYEGFNSSATSAVARVNRGTGSLTVGAQVGQSTVGSIYVANTGTDGLSFSSFTFSDPAFSVNPDGTTCLVDDNALQAGGTCILNLLFSPTTPKTYTATLTIDSTSGNGSATPSSYTLNGQTPQSTTTLFVSPNPATFGQAITFGAVVTAQFFNGSTNTNVTPTGTVDFLDSNNTVIGSGTLATAGDGDQEATFTTSALAGGTYTVHARYNGSTTVGAGTSGPTTLVVNGGPTAQPTTTNLTSSASTVVSGQPVTLTATIAGASSPALTGSVNFVLGITVVGTAPVTSTGTGGIATLTTTTLPVGQDSILAVYSGDANYATSTSNGQQVIVTSSAATTVALTAAPATVAYRSPITLTASVTNSSSAPLTTGQVYFCDLAVRGCNAYSNLGTVQLNPAGNAVLRLAAGTIGSHSYTATFIATASASASVSTEQTVAVTGIYPSSSTLVSSGGVGAYSLLGTVVGLGDRTAGPTGTLTFSDTSNTGTPVLGTASLAPATLAFTTTPATGSPNTVGTHPYGIASGDFNGDGFMDVVTENYDGASVSVLLGNGDGTFEPQVSYPAGNLPERVLVADFNGDGNLDLVVANTGSGSISILLGVGDGTFMPQVTYAVASPVGLGVMDLNHDGIADIAVGDYYTGSVSILLGVGDGTFHPAVTYQTGTTPQTLAEGDFDKDGNVDLVIGNFGDNTISILRGNGDGTFQPQVTYPVGSRPQGVQVADLNNDGFLDIAVTNSGDNTISVLIGQDDGTFQAQVTYPVGIDPVGLVIADFNGDGFLDLSTGNTGTAAQTDLTESYLLGNGDGTFQAQIKYPTGNFPYGQVAADFNGDGYPDLAISDFSDSTAGILLSQVTQTATATLTPVNVTGTAGTHNVDVSYPADANFAASVSPTIPLVSAPSVAVASTTSLTIAPLAATAGQNVLFTVSVAGAGQTTPVPTGTVTLASSGGGLGTTTITLGASGAGSFSTSQIPVGTYSVTASYSGDTNYAASVSAPRTLVVSLATQTIAFPAIASHTIEDAPFTLSATASSGLAVTYTLVSGPATISGNTLTLTGATGTVVVQASQAGNTTYAAAPSVTQSFTVSGAPLPTLTGITPAAITLGSAATTITLTGTNFNSVDVLRLNGTGTIATTFVNATTLTAVIPASALATAGTIQVAVSDLIGKTTSNALTITVSNTPAVVFTGPTTPPASGQQPTLTFQLTNPYPVPLTASFNLLFTPATTPAVDDPAIQFAGGGRNYTFTVAANSVVTPPIQLQAGTEAGTITVPVTLTAQGVDVTPASLTPVVIVIPPAAPVVSLVTMNSTGGGVNVVVTGYSNTREATQAKFHFTAASGADLNTPDFTANINPLFGTWYSSAASAPYGSTVVYTQSFTLDSGTASTITGVTVTLTNSIGTSNTGSSQ
ncbi:FG-GAP-like repeat-containing protein [Granulicella sibirica]|uniref:Putative aggregation factor core protein MAFp3, isoform C n=1 Tax=Granulicella sibirica TaxID=2479048 RepID=A0A4Q0SYZ6_9BACT|nr:FG-GAP-like repeat-containing protein [Granulicella sibirica]RXH54759.1 putative aggregation factor core protein MAFp3, isoform C [Granulicella sibirica]